MPTVPFTGPGQGPRLLPQGQQDVRATPAMFGGLQAEAMGQASRQLEKAGNALQDAAVGLRRQDQVRERTAWQTQIVTGLADLRTQMDKETDPDAIERLWREGTQERLGAILANIRAPQDQEWVRLRFQQEVAQEQRSVGRQIEIRRREANIATLNQSLFDLANAADQARDPEARERALASGRAAIAAAANAGTIGRDDEQKLTRQFLGQADLNMARRLIRENPAAARALIERSPYLTVEQRISLDDRLSAELARREAQARAEMARRERQLGIAVGEEQRLLAAGFFNPDRIATLKESARGTAYEPIIDRMAAEGREIAAFATLPLTEQAARLQALEAQARGPDAATASAAAAQLQRLGSIVRAQQTDLNQIGLARAVADGVVPELPAWNAADGAVFRQYVDAAQAASAHYGRPVSAFTSQIAQQTAQQFVTASPEQKLAILNAVVGIEDQAVRAATLQHIERVRGDAGRLEPGSLVRIADMARGSFEGQQRALRLLSALTTDTSDRVKQAGESAEIRSALESARSRGVLAVRMAQAQATNGDGRFTQIINRDLGNLQRLAAYYLATGMASSATDAVRKAQADWEYGLGTVQDSGASVYFPAAAATAAEVSAGLRVLRDRYVAGAVPEGAADADAALMARTRQAAARSARWINEGSQFSLVAQGAAGAPVVLERRSLDDVLAAARAKAAEDAAAAPRTGLDRRLELEREQQRRRPPLPRLPGD